MVLLTCVQFVHFIFLPPSASLLPCRVILGQSKGTPTSDDQRHSSPTGNAVAVTDEGHGDRNCDREGVEAIERLFSPNELREIVHALMRLSRLPDSLANASFASTAFPRGWKLACALAVTAIGLNKDASCMDVPRKVCGRPLTTAHTISIPFHFGVCPEGLGGWEKKWRLSEVQ